MQNYSSLLSVENNDGDNDNDRKRDDYRTTAESLRRSHRSANHYSDGRAWKPRLVMFFFFFQ